MMSQFIEKKRKEAKVLKIILPILTAMWFGSFFLINNLEFAVAYPIVMLLGVAFLTCVIIYFASYMPFLSGVKWLEERGLEGVADDIILEKPTLPRSKIYCGQRALFSKKPYAIIPYSEIAWVYLYERRTNGILVEKAFILYTKDGKKFTLNAHEDEFKWLLENYIIPNSPNVVIGYGAKQKAQYKQLNPEWAKAGKKVKKIWGIVLMSLGIIFMILLIINFKEAKLVPVTILILGCLSSGLILYRIGKK